MTGTDEHPADEASVLSSLPGTRPQRRSPKRAAAKPDGGASAPAAEGPASTGRARPPRTRRPVTAPPAEPVAGETPPEAPDPAARSVAAQGFEADPIQGTVNPPTGAELVASVAQGATELAEIGLSLARRLARSVLDRLPRP